VGGQDGGVGGAEVLGLVDELWSRPVHERRVAAILVLERWAAVLEAQDLALVERLLRDSRTWAYVDALAVQTAGRLVERFPRLAHDLDRWARDGNFWLRRAAML